MIAVVRHWSERRGVGSAVMCWPNSGTVVRLAREGFAVAHIRAGAVRTCLRRGQAVVFTAVSPTGQALGILRIPPLEAKDEAPLPPLDPVPPAPPPWPGTGTMVANNHFLPTPQTAPRTCIRCGVWFASTWAGHRVCDACNVAEDPKRDLRIFSREEEARLWAFAIGGNGNGG